MRGTEIDTAAPPKLQVGVRVLVSRPPCCLMSPAPGSLANTAILHADSAHRQPPTRRPPCRLQAALAPRLSGYPAHALEQMHVAHALVPAAVAHLLHAEPQLLAAAVEAFHYRDPDDVKVRVATKRLCAEVGMAVVHMSSRMQCSLKLACGSAAVLTPSPMLPCPTLCQAASRMAAFPPRDMVLAAPTFSRCLFAQLALQEYAPPRGYPMPLPSDAQVCLGWGCGAAQAGVWQH